MMKRILIACKFLLLLTTMVEAQTYSDDYIWNKVFDATNSALYLKIGAGSAVPVASHSMSYIWNKVFDNASSTLRVSVVSGGAGGNTTDVQYNNAGSLAGTDDFVWDNTNKILTLQKTASTAQIKMEGGGMDSFLASSFFDMRGTNVWVRLGNNTEIGGKASVGTVDSTGTAEFWVTSANDIKIGDVAGSSALTCNGTTALCSFLNTVTAPSIIPTQSTAGQGGFWGGVVWLVWGGSISQSTVLIANNIRVFQFVLPFRSTITKISSEVVTIGGAGKFYGIGIYDASGNLKIQTGAVDANTAQVNNTTPTTPASVTLDAGVYYFAWTSDSATVQLRSISTNGATFSGYINSGSARRAGICANSSTAGVFNSTCGVITANSASVNHPLAFFEP